MSHLQPKFIAKAKASHKRGQAVREMPRTMRLKATHDVIEVGGGKHSRKPKRDRDEPLVWYFDVAGGPYYLQHSLRKGK